MYCDFDPKDPEHDPDAIRLKEFHEKVFLAVIPSLISKIELFPFSVDYIDGDAETVAQKNEDMDQSWAIQRAWFIADDAAENLALQLGISKAVVETILYVNSPVKFEVDE